MSVAASYYDGRTSRRHAVQLSAQGGGVRVEGDGVRRDVPRAELAVSERLGQAPRQVRFADGAFCEVRDLEALDGLLAALGHVPAPVERWQHSLRFALLSAALLVVLFAAGYAWGVPWAAQAIANRLPPEVDAALSRRVLEALDDGLLGASTLPAERRDALAAGFAALARPEGAAAGVRLRFGAIDGFGANAFALPDGTVVVLDDLVKLCDHDEQVYAVLAHELGHVHHRHGERLLLQGTLVGAVAAWWFGDLSGLLAAAPAALLQSRYSREFEAEADRFAAAMLRANRLEPARLAEALEKLAAAHGRVPGDRRWADYVSSHPAPEERLEALRRQ